MAELIEDRDSEDRALRIIVVLVLLGTIVGGGVDLVMDGPESWVSVHALFEMAWMAIAVGTSLFLWRGWWRSKRSLRATEAVLAERGAERDAWRASAEAALAGLGRAIDERFMTWELTPAEREVAVLLLKGRSHKQIAYATGRSERTVRQHAVAVYQKSGLNGRAELAAFFLEDLMVPSTVPDQGEVAAGASA